MSEQKEITAKKTPKKTALGRGLGSLLGNSTPIEEEPLTKLPPMKSETNSALKEGFIESPAQPKIPDTARVWKIAVDKIYPNVNQPRQVFDAEPLKELSASIREKGVLQPIVARKMPDGGYEIIAGERRWRAAQQAGLHEVPVILKESDDQEAMELALIENIQRADLNPVEEAEAYAHLIKKYNLTQQKLAEQVGKDRVTIANTMRLLNLAPEVRVMVSKGEISMGQAKVLLSVDDPKVQRQLAKKVCNDKLSVRATEKLVLKRFKQPQGNNGVEEIDISGRLAKGLADELQKIMGTKVAIDYFGGKGKIAISFYSDDELNQMADKFRTAWQK
ncbi:MAG: ParB/RepB/Spo0J family partition protein [Bdellovibrionaceae bacterium]|nr:ParB/RepB/Spo0J family partition protein [Bdellovibrionales bacterium]MCB9085465.1 ParB/RepB/Spo0J family partition protein [Pseudobdellovibrionaceae bacterium]